MNVVIQNTTMIPYRLILIVGLLCLSLPVFSQTYIGLKGGINQSKSTFFFNINPVDATSKGDLNGFYFSIPVEIKINDYFNLMPELAFMSDGTILSVQSQEEQRVYNNAIFYVKMPILGKLKIFKKKEYEFGIVGGIIPAFAMDVKSYYFTYSNLRRIIDVPVNLKEAGIRRFDIALSIGVNTEKVIAKGWKILLDIRYNGGIFDIETHSPLTNTSESFQLTFGLLAPLVRKKKLVKLANKISL